MEVGIVAEVVEKGNGSDVFFAARIPGLGLTAYAAAEPNAIAKLGRMADALKDALPYEEWQRRLYKAGLYEDSNLLFRRGVNYFV